jgi:hypothetical protein
MLLGVGTLRCITGCTLFTPKPPPLIDLLAPNFTPNFPPSIDYRDVKMHLPVGGWTIDMCHLMDGQPVDVAIRDVSTGE